MPETPGPLDPYVPLTIRLRSEATWYRECGDFYDTANLLDEAADKLDAVAYVLENLLEACE